MYTATEILRKKIKRQKWTKPEKYALLLGTQAQ